MPYSIHWHDRAVVFAYSKTVTSQDLLLSNQEVYGDERFDRLRWQLVFFDEVEGVEFSPSDIKLIAYMDRGAAISNPNITVAFVGESALLDEVRKIYATHAKTPAWPVTIFQSRESAWDAVGQQQRVHKR